MPHLTSQQLQVVDGLSGGATLTTAAAQAVHRNTIANWRCDSNDSREALSTAHDDRAVDLADLAF